MSDEYTVDNLIEAALVHGLIKNKTEGKKLKKAGLLELLAAHKAQAKADAAIDKMLTEIEQAPATPVVEEKVVVVEEDWPTRGHLTAMQTPETAEVIVPSEEKDLHHDHAHDSPENVLNPAADNILRRYGNQFRTSRGGERRDRSKAKAARRARKITRRNRK